MLSPTVAQRLTSHLNGGFYMGRAAAAAQQPDQHSSWGSYAVTEHANGDGYLAEAGRVQSGLGRGHVAQDAVGNGYSAEPHQRNLSPELGRPLVLADGHKCPPPPRCMKYLASQHCPYQPTSTEACQKCCLLLCCVGSVLGRIACTPLQPLATSTASLPQLQLAVFANVLSCCALSKRRTDLVPWTQPPVLHSPDLCRSLSNAASCNCRH